MSGNVATAAHPLPVGPPGTPQGALRAAESQGLFLQTTTITT